MGLSLVIPAHDEEHRIAPTLQSYREALSDSDQIVVALDRCTDGTASVVMEQAKSDNRITLLEFPKLGKGGVIMEAFRSCPGDLIGFVDADGATPPAEFLRLVDAASRPGVDGAIASRRHPAAVLPADRSRGRKMASTAFALGVGALFKLPYGDTQCGAKVFRREVIESCLPFLSSRDLLFDVDLLAVASQLGYRITEIPTVWIDKEGSKIGLVSDSKRMALSSVRLWLHQRVMPVVTRQPVTNEPSRRVGLEVIDLTDDADAYEGASLLHMQHANAVNESSRMGA